MDGRHREGEVGGSREMDGGEPEAGGGALSRAGAAGGAMGMDQVRLMDKKNTLLCGPPSKLAQIITPLGDSFFEWASCKKLALALLFDTFRIVWLKLALTLRSKQGLYL
jgi:hypothetical protein